ncbi:hypothetical protein GCM10022254_40770 [Actinomadura meridiana]|uniref:Uncharacterized protein n=1 Tax=Actinomadura meridiana TaxID=559626 RepID=A0ABP8C752_9ACTN
MEKVPNSAPPGSTDRNGDAATFTDLFDEFPGWTIKRVRQNGSGSLLWRAACAGAAGHLAVEVDSLARLREVLDELDRIECRHAAIALRDELRALGVDAQAYGLTVSAMAEGGTRRGVTAHRGVYGWTSGVLLGTVCDPAATARAMLPGLGMA